MYADIRFTASTYSCESEFFRSEDDFIAYLDTLWSTGYGGRRFEAKVLRDDEPARFPCLMLIAGERELANRQDEIQNVFLYDVEIHSGLETEED